jgi:hypothetical protein
MATIVGKEISICNLKNRSELNGEKGFVQEDLANGRFQVTLIRDNISISVKKENLTVITAVVDDKKEPLKNDSYLDSILEDSLNEISIHESNTKTPKAVPETHHRKSPSVFSACNASFSMNPNSRVWQTKSHFYPFY